MFFNTASCGQGNVPVHVVAQEAKDHDRGEYAKDDQKIRDALSIDATSTNSITLNSFGDTFAIHYDKDSTV